MGLPEYPPARVQAPAWAGVGLRREFEDRMASRPPPEWPEDWWQRNYDTLCEDGPEPMPLCGRQLTIPPATVTP